MPEKPVPGYWFEVGDEVQSVASGTSLVIRGVLGRGSFGTTYECERPDGSLVALKVLQLRELKNWKALTLFEREAKTLSGLSHPAIPEYVDSFEIETAGDVKYCLVQRIAPGKSLQDLVDSGWRPTEKEVEAIAEQLLEVTEYLGSLRPPVVHRDIKPGNVLLDRASGKVSLVDFGATADAAVTAAAAADFEGDGSRSWSMGSTMIGTFGYAAPEQMMGGVTASSDLYSVGATLLFILSGRSPSTFGSTRLKINFRGAVTIDNPRLEAVLARLLEPSPEDRFEEARQALDFLRTGSFKKKSSKYGGVGGRESGANFRGRQWEREEEERLRKVAELEWAEANEQLPWYKRKTETVENPDYDGFGRWVEDEDGNETWEEDESPTMEVSPMAKFRNEVSTTSRAPRRRLKKPAGTKVQVEREGKTKLLVIVPPTGLNGAALGLGSFAVVWNSFIAFWTVSAFAGAGLLFASFSLPFWLVGGGMVKEVYGMVFQASRLELDAANGTWSLGITSTGLKNKVEEGALEDVDAAKVVVTSVTNGTPTEALSLQIGVDSKTFGAGLTSIEQEWLAAEINSFLRETSAD